MHTPPPRIGVQSLPFPLSTFCALPATESMLQKHRQDSSLPSNSHSYRFFYECLVWCCLAETDASKGGRNTMVAGSRTTRKQTSKQTPPPTTCCEDVIIIYRMVSPWYLQNHDLKELVMLQ